MTVVAVIGMLTAFFAATIGLFQYDIKKVLAYSTVSQLGYMFIGVGVGAWLSQNVYALGTLNDANGVIDDISFFEDGAEFWKSLELARAPHQNRLQGVDLVPEANPHSGVRSDVVEPTPALRRVDVEPTVADLVVELYGVGIVGPGLEVQERVVDEGPVVDGYGDDLT